MDDNAAKTVPLKAYDPPAIPAEVELLRWRGRQGHVRQRGVGHAGEWIVDGKLERLAQVLPSWSWSNARSSSLTATGLGELDAVLAWP